jgi:hypothetical protein
MLFNNDYVVYVNEQGINYTQLTIPHPYLFKVKSHAGSFTVRCIAT